jgi:hypothetical protein
MALLLSLESTDLFGTSCDPLRGGGRKFRAATREVNVGASKVETLAVAAADQEVLVHHLEVLHVPDPKHQARTEVDVQDSAVFRTFLTERPAAEVNQGRVHFLPPALLSESILGPLRRGL